MKLIKWTEQVQNRLKWKNVVEIAKTLPELWRRRREELMTSDTAVLLRHCESSCSVIQCSIKMKMNMEKWWNVTDRGKLKYSDKELSSATFHKKCYTDWCDIETKFTQSEAGD
jgi:hypothetical protein